MSHNKEINSSWIQAFTPSSFSTDHEKLKKNHQPSMPFVREIVHLLPLAYRMREYIKLSHKNNELPIFDLDQNTLSPPQPGPYAGAPLGGIGSGSIGRGCRGDFSRFNLSSNSKYIHQVMESNVFAVRVKRGEVSEAIVLSLLPPENTEAPSSSTPVNSSWLNSSSSTAIDSSVSHFSLMSSWNWTLEPRDVLYEARYPLAKHEYTLTNVGLKVIIWQISPILPHNYIESSFPCGSFSIEVENLDEKMSEDVEISTMFLFENGINSGESPMAHELFKSNEEPAKVLGICMPHMITKKVYLNENNGQPPKSNLTFQSFSVAVSSSEQESEDETELSYCKEFISSIDKKSNLLDKISNFFSNNTTLTATELDAKKFTDSLWKSFADTGSISESLASCPLASAYLCEEFPREPSNDIYRISSALCGKKKIKLYSPKEEKSFNASSQKVFKFSLAWTYPHVMFGGEDKTYKRYYTKWIGDSFNGSIPLSIYSNLKTYEWRQKILQWQQAVIDELLVDKDSLDKSGEKSSQTSCFQDVSSHMYHMIFNELYFLIDGGTVWLDSNNGTHNSSSKEDFFNQDFFNNVSSICTASICDYIDSLKITTDTLGDQTAYGQFLYLEGHEYLMYNTYDVHFYASFSLIKLFPQLQFSTQRDFAQAVLISDNEQRKLISGESNKEEKITIISDNTKKLPHLFSSPPLNICDDYDKLGIRINNINPYEKLFPMHNGVFKMFSSSSKKKNLIVRKKIGKVPHDLGSPSGCPFSKLNAYNFQDVSLWKDLPSKFILMSYRDIVAIENWQVSKKDNPDTHFYVENFDNYDRIQYIEQIFSVCERVYLQTFIDSIIPLWNLTSEHYYAYLTKFPERKHKEDDSFVSVYDTINIGFYYLDNEKDYENIQESYFDQFKAKLNEIDQENLNRNEKIDSNISFIVRNSGFPDQTYDIWTAFGIHSYCGGLWVASTLAMAHMSSLLIEYYKDNAPKCQYYTKVNNIFNSIASHSKKEYVDSLWNGHYLDYDNSKTGENTHSIMSDMLAGHYYSRVCGMEPIIEDKKCLHSCLRTIFYHNVLGFSTSSNKRDEKILLRGAVNGMKPSASFKDNFDQLPFDPIECINSNENSSYYSLLSTLSSIDNSCLQSREVWAGTTYLLSSLFLLEAKERQKEEGKGGDSKDLLSSSSLYQMSLITSKGIHDAGWREAGYQFATPEAYEHNLNYRSLGYMRPLSIWSRVFPSASSN